MTIYSSISYLKSSPRGPLIVDPISGSQRFIEGKISELIFSEENLIQKEWREKGWLHTMRIVASKKSLTDAVEKFSKVDRFLTGDLYHVAMSALSRRTVRKFSKEKLDKDALDELEAHMMKLSVLFKGFSFHVFRFGVSNGLSKIVQIKDGTIGHSFTSKDPLLRESVSKCIAGMPASLSSSVTIFLVCDFKVALEHLGNSFNIPLIFNLAGQIFQKILLVLPQIGACGVPSPALSDRPTKTLLKLESEFAWPLYSLAVGREQ